MKYLEVGCWGFCTSNDPKIPLVPKFLITQLRYSSGVTTPGTLSDATRVYTNIPEWAEMVQNPALNLVFVKTNMMSSLPAQSAKKHTYETNKVESNETPT